jgi:hypothetical protein
MLGVSGEGTTFIGPRNYTRVISALIYTIRLLTLEWTLPQYPHTLPEWPQRPDHDQVARLNIFRKLTLCYGVDAPFDELSSLRAWGHSLQKSDGGAYKFFWSDDGNQVSWNDRQSTLHQFSQLQHTTLATAQELSVRLMYGLQAKPHLMDLIDRWSNKSPGYSFVTEPKNRLSYAYLSLSERACSAALDGLMTSRGWDLDAVSRYLALEQQLLGELLLLVQFDGGQPARGPDLLAVQTVNSATTRRGIFVHHGRIVFVYHSSKRRAATHRDFHVARYLTEHASTMWYHYLVYIRPFCETLRRKCLGIKEAGIHTFSDRHNGSSVWSSQYFSQLISNKSLPIYGFSLGLATYRQLSAAMTERHVKQDEVAGTSLDDRSLLADVNVSFAWQSGHRNQERMSTYGLDGAFPDSLQPSLLRVYRWASVQWHEFLKRASRPPVPVVVIPPPSTSVAMNMWLDSSATVLGSLQPSVPVSLSPTRSSPEVEAHEPQRPLCVTCGQDMPKNGRKRAAPSSSLPHQASASKRRATTFRHVYEQAQGEKGSTDMPPHPNVCPLSRAQFIRVLPSQRVLLCTEHGSCYTHKTVMTHFKQRHDALHEQFSAFQDWCASLNLAEALPFPADHSPPIDGIQVYDGITCNTAGCMFRSRSTDRISRHIAREHQVAGERVQRQKNMFSHIRMQTLISMPPRWFIVNEVRTGERREQLS